MKDFRVIKGHSPSDPDGLQGEAGERLGYERRETKYPGWVWCRDAQGRESWTPEAWLRFEGDEAILLRDYTAREITLTAGDRVTIELEQNEWAMVVREDGERGWAPLACLEPD